MQWWDDLWLNEGFATWAETKMLDAWKPAFGASLGAIAEAGHVMDADALTNARAVRQPVRSRSDAMEAFDELTYEKGAAVLRMLESWLGAETFRRGVQQYLQQNAWKNARADDLFHALEYVSTEKVAPLANGFLDQPGVPAVGLRDTGGHFSRVRGLGLERHGVLLAEGPIDGGDLGRVFLGGQANHGRPRA